VESPEARGGRIGDDLVEPDVAGEVGRVAGTGGTGFGFQDLHVSTVEGVSPPLVICLTYSFFEV
jgi:hypothetical protein